MARSATALSLRRPPGHESQSPDMLGQAVRKSASQAGLVMDASSAHQQHPVAAGSSQEGSPPVRAHGVLEFRFHAPTDSGTGIGTENASQVATAGVPKLARLASSSQAAKACPRKPRRSCRT